MVRLLDGWMVRCLDDQMVALKNGWMIIAWLDGLMDRLLTGCTWLDGWMVS